MKKKLTGLLILLFLVVESYGCSCGSYFSFCNSHTNHDLTATCVIADTFQHGISMKVLHVWNGNENKDTINVWDIGGPYDLCNDSISSMATFLGNIGDTLIISLPKIDSIKNSWDVIGDYKMPGFICWEYKLTVVNDTVKGLISGSENCYYLNNCLLSYDYDSFLTDFPVKSKNCETWLTIDNPSTKEYFTIYPNPAKNFVQIKTSENGIVTLTNYAGQIISTFSAWNNQTTFSTSNFPSGIYFLTFKAEKKIITKKLIIQH